MRKTILACTVSFLMSPMTGWALGMGDIQVNSSLNQPLKAEISLHSVTKKDLDSLHINLAPRNIYTRANIERSEYLSNFRFKLIQRNGKNYIAVTTKKPFREPFANFLIEATWSSGRLLREYTMLLDPPEFVKRHARPVTTATASRSSQVKRTQSKSTRKAASPSRDSNVVLSPSSGDLSYGPTKRNDTLWNIAKDMAPNNVSVDQMMLAILRDNPEAFVNNNINNLKAGYVLRIKDRDSLNKLSRSNAHRQVKEQYRSWKEARKQKPVSNIVDRSDRSSENASADGQLKLIASGESSNADVQGDLSSKATQLKEKLVLAGEDLESKEVENQELRARINELEELLKTKSSLVELKDESLAALQKQKEMQAMESSEVIIDTPEESAVEEVVVEEVVVEETSTVEMSDAGLSEHIDPSVELSNSHSSEYNFSQHIDPSVELANDEQMLSESTMPVNVDEIITIAEVAQPEAAQPEVEKSKPVEQAVPESKTAPEPAVKTESKPMPKPQKTAAHQENVLDVLLSEEMLPYTAGASGLLVLILGWLGLRGRGKKDNEFEESILDSKLDGNESDFIADDSQLVASSLSTSEVLASDTETSFLSDFSADDMESLQPDDTEADPIAEADVFMVYGRYQQAEELLQSAITKEPERTDYQLKLLEVYHGDNSKDSFAVQADVVKDVLEKTNDDYELTPEWIKAKSWAEKLGVDIDMPDTFDEGISVTDESLVSEDSLDGISDDLSLESEEINFSEDSILGDAEISDDEFDLSLDDVDALADTEDTAELSLDDSAFELSLEDIDSEGIDSKDIDSKDIDSNSTANEFDLDESTLNLDEALDLDDDLEPEQSANSEDSLELGDSLELEDNLELETDSLELGDDLELDADTLALDDVDNSLATEGDDLDLLDDDLNFDELEDDFPELDAVGTKLDLAKAYIDMGDMESASSILNEVIDEGDEEQKSQAKSLLDQTDS